MKVSEVTAVIIQESAKISCNFEQVEKALQDRLSEYKGAVFTEESKAMAKKHVASLRAEKKKLQDNLRDAKKEYMKEWDRFEPQAKELIGMYDPVIDLINGQIQGHEAKRIERKRELIAGIYGELVPESLRDYIPLTGIYDRKWENATTKEKDIRNEISSLAEKTQKDLAAIQKMDSEAVEKAMEVYRRRLDLSEAMSYISSYENQKKEILTREQERQRREEEERVRRQERERLLAEQSAREEKEAALRQVEREKQESLRRAEEEKAEALRMAELERREEARRAEAEKAAAVEQARAEAAQEVIDSLAPDIDEEEETEFCVCNVILTKRQKDALETYMNSVGIDWEWV